MTTQFATASYQEVIDLHTETDRVSVLGIHTPVSDAPYTFLEGFFNAFQKYHYDGCSLALVPAARLPADPSQVSYEAGEQPIDPRDLLNPILWHGAHGESLGSVLNQFYSGQASTNDVSRDFSSSIEKNDVLTSRVGTDALWQSLYYRALTDNTWKKAHPQQGFRLGGLRPLVYSLGTNVQFANSREGLYTPNIPEFDSSAGVLPGNAVESMRTGGEMGLTSGGTGLNVTLPQGLQNSSVTPSEVSTRVQPNGSGLQFFSERLHRLGWLDTRSRLLATPDSQSAIMTGDLYDDRVATSELYSNVEQVERINYLPRLFMGICLLPPAYKTEQYYRLVLNHRFSFRKFRGLSMRGEIVGRYPPGAVPSYHNML